MRISCAVVVAAWLMSSAAEVRADLQCATSPENDRRVAALHAKPRERARFAAHSAALPMRRDGAIYLQANDGVTPGYRPFDLAGESLVFTPGAGGGYAVSREPLRYTEPASAGKLTGQYLPADLGFTFSAFGRSVQRVYVTGFLGITFDEPRDYDVADGFSEVEALMRSQPLIAPLAQAGRSLRTLPAVHVDRTPSSLIVTWRSSTHPAFGYDVQAQLHADGAIVFSYRTLRNVHWGTPVLAPGALPRRTLFDAEGAAGTTGQTDPQFRDMLDMRRVEVFRIAESEVISLRMTLAGAIDRTRIQDGQRLLYEFNIANGNATDSVSAIVTRDDVFVSTWGEATLDRVTARVEGNTVELFGIQQPGGAGTPRLNAVTFLSNGGGRPADVAEYELTLDAAPRRVAVDLSAAGGAELALPIVEPFLLPVLDPVAVWEQLQAAYGFRDDEIDAVAIYQTFFTDLILYATAYATVGNPRVDGIHPAEAGRGRGHPRSPTLMHMNQLSFDENADDRMASVVVLHEFGHRWLYTLRFADGQTMSNVLSPQRYHPAAWVDTRSAFPLYGAEESSVMGGGHFTNIGGNRYRARSLRYGYSWTDLYLMGLAGADEVPPWFYLGATNPALPAAYFPEDRIEVTGTKREVALSQVVAALGPRNPAPAMSQREFRVLFVLLTDPGKEATSEEIAQLEWLRGTLERDFTRATGGRGRVTTDRPAPQKRRSVR